MADNMNFNSTTVFGEVKVLMLKGEKGDAGSSGDYAGLTNKPTINGVTLSGNISSDSLGVASQSFIDEVQQSLETLTEEIESPTWVDLPLNSDQSYITKTAMLYSKSKGGEVTIAMNLDFISTPYEVKIANLPAEITPQNTSGGWQGIQRYFPVRHTARGAQYYLRISGSSLYFVPAGGTISAGDYITCEEKYNPVI